MKMMILILSLTLFCGSTSAAWSEEDSIETRTGRIAILKKEKKRLKKELKTETTENEKTKNKRKDLEVVEDKLKKEQFAQQFAGGNWGAAISVTYDLGSIKRADEAIIDSNNIVRVTKTNNAIVRPMLETHYFFVCNNFPEWGHGPFIAVQPGSQNLIDAVGFGYMFGFRRQDSSSSFNIGVGGMVDPQTRVLGDGFDENEKSPVNETQIRYKYTDQWGVMVIGSFTY